MAKTIGGILGFIFGIVVSGGIYFGIYAALCAFFNIPLNFIFGITLMVILLIGNFVKSLLRKNFKTE